jgi:hypothetical protein
VNGGPAVARGAAVNRTPKRSATVSAADRADAGTTTASAAVRDGLTPRSSSAFRARTSAPSRSVSSRSRPAAAVTAPVRAAALTPLVVTRGAAAALMSTVAPQSRRWLQPEMSYIWGTRSEMSRPASSMTLARPRFGWCMSTTYEPLR